MLRKEIFVTDPSVLEELLQTAHELVGIGRVQVIPVDAGRWQKQRWRRIREVRRFTLLAFDEGAAYLIAT